MGADDRCEQSYPCRQWTSRGGSHGNLYSALCPRIWRCDPLPSTQFLAGHSRLGNSRNASQYSPRTPEFQTRAHSCPTAPESRNAVSSFLWLGPMSLEQRRCRSGLGGEKKWHNAHFTSERQSKVRVHSVRIAGSTSPNAGSESRRGRWTGVGSD